MSEPFVPHEYDSEKGEWILKPDMSAPTRGLFAVKLIKGGLRRSLTVIQYEIDAHGFANKGDWAVFLDGILVAPPNPSWQKAFGKLCEKESLFGQKLTSPEHERLLNARQADKKRGLDLDAPQDISKVPVP